ncbi:MAG: FHA domain-containing protein [Chitinophagales bacterium]
MRITLTWSKPHSSKKNTKAFNLDRTLTIGRSSSCSIVLEDRGVSRQHACITLDRDEPLLEDCSVNGTWMNAQSVSQSVLKENMSFQIMSYCFQVVDIEDSEAHNPKQDNKKPSAIQPVLDLAAIIKKQPFIENLIDLMPDK